MGILGRGCWVSMKGREGGEGIGIGRGKKEKWKDLFRVLLCEEDRLIDFLIGFYGCIGWRTGFDGGYVFVFQCFERATWTVYVGNFKSFLPSSLRHVSYLPRLCSTQVVLG